MLPFPDTELPLSFHLAAFPAFALLQTSIAPEIGGISFAPSAGCEHTFGMPSAAPRALLLQAVVRTLPLAALAQTLVILALPLRFREFRFEGLCVAAVAHVRGHVLLLDGFPVHVLAAQDLQQKVGAFEVALVEQSSVERPEYQEVLHLLDSGESHIAGHRARACANLHVNNGCIQSLPLGSVGGP